uniref:NADH dehydrogenase [ubiquinone] 1 beta subcomplex subunit 5, mitochondrial n=1 Tax=Eubosmina coregoni TaxID=186181 RepID=A0A4Y7LP77_9CRUS|nr:EOG090X0FIE [Eubosmina coregoni]SVE70116.1 EOG090X0FIE [Eubosmina coregoni]
MAVMSLLRSPNTLISKSLIREMSGGHHTFQIKPARWSWNKFKDMLHFYTMVAVIPSTIVITCINIFIGPAKLVPIPEGYNPQEYEYHQHPITRWMAKNITKSYQQEYEMHLHNIYEQEYRMKLRATEAKVKAKMRENQDVQTYYYQPVSTRYYKYASEINRRAPEEGGTS